MFSSTKLLNNAGSSQGGAASSTSATTVLLLDGDGTNGGQNNTFLDSSSNNTAITKTGTVVQGTFSPYNNAWSIYFNSSYLSIVPSSIFDITAGAWTMECWYYPISPGSYQGIFGQRNDSNVGWNATVTATGEWGYYNSAGGSTYANAGAALVKGYTWNHLVLSSDGTTVRHYVNGVYTKSGTTSGTTKLPFSGSTNFLIGANKPARDEPANGYISNFRFVKGTQLYTTATITVPTAPLTSVTGTQLLACHSNTLNISTGIAGLTSTIPTVGSASIDRFSPFSQTAAYSNTVNGGSAYFGGIGTNLLLPHLTGHNLTADFTIELWVYWPYNNTTGGGILVCKGGGLNIAWASYEIYIDNATSNVRFAGSTTNTGYDIGGESAAGNLGIIAKDCWTHVAVTRQGNVFRGFVNGVQGFTQTVSGSLYNSSPRGLAIGSNYTTTWGTGTPTASYNGYISDLRIINGTALYTANFSVPTLPLTAITNTQLLCSFTNSSIIDKAMTTNLDTIGNVQISTTQKKFGTGSMYFNGTSSYLTDAYLPGKQFNFTYTSFTVETWVYITAAPTGDTCIFDNLPIGGIGTRGGSFVLVLRSDSKLYVYSSGAFATGSNKAVALNQWVHIALVRNGSSSCTYYINGVDSGSATLSTGLGSNGCVIGRLADVASGYFTGYMDDFKVTKGAALYTSNFTPTSAAGVAPVDPYWANTVLLLRGNGDLLDSSSTPKTFSSSGASGASTTTKMFGTGSLYFDGASGLYRGNHNDFNFGTGDFTVEFWLYSSVAWTSQPSSCGIVGQKANDSTNGWVIYRDGGYPSKLNARLTQQNNFPTASTPATNTWEHWALVRNGSTLSWYKNGVLDATTTNTSNISDSTGNFYCGYSQTWAGFLKGYLDDIRITKGVARYTTNFNPSAALSG